MKLAVAKDSLFAVLLRSPWWISMIVAGAIFAAARLVVPDLYAFFCALPVMVIGVVSGWRQLRTPSDTRVAATIEAARAMSWDDFSEALAAALRRDGYTVKRLDGAAADFEIAKAGHASLVGCKRWKAARTGVEPLRELHAAARAGEARECLYVAAGEVTDSARAFAAQRNIRLIGSAELAKLLPRPGRA